MFCFYERQQTGPSRKSQVIWPGSVVKASHEMMEGNKKTHKNKTVQLNYVIWHNSKASYLIAPLIN